VIAEPFNPHSRIKVLLSQATATSPAPFCELVSCACATGKWIYVAHAMRNMPLHLAIKTWQKQQQRREQPEQIRSHAPGLRTSSHILAAMSPPCWSHKTFIVRNRGEPEILFIEANLLPTWMCSPGCIIPISTALRSFGLPFRLLVYTLREKLQWLQKYQYTFKKLLGILKHAKLKFIRFNKCSDTKHLSWYFFLTYVLYINVIWYSVPRTNLH